MKPHTAQLSLALVPLLSGCSLFFPNRPVDLSPPEVLTSPSGVQFEELRSGQGVAVVAGAQVRLHYTGWLADGVQFDSSHDRGRPISFTVGQASVVQGWEEGMLGMRPGGVRRLTIPPHLAYGEQGLGQHIPPGSTLVIEVQLLASTPPAE